MINVKGSAKRVYMLDFISSPSATCSPAPCLKSIGPKSTVCSSNRKAVPVTGAVTSHTVQIPHMRIPYLKSIGINNNTIIHVEYASTEPVRGISSHKARKEKIRLQFDGGNLFFVFFAFLRVSQLLFEGCLELQPELSVTTCWISGLRAGRCVEFWIVHSVIGHRMPCFGPMDFI